MSRLYKGFLERFDVSLSDCIPFSPLKSIRLPHTFHGKSFGDFLEENNFLSGDMVISNFVPATSLKPLCFMLVWGLTSQQRKEVTWETK